MSFFRRSNYFWKRIFLKPRTLLLLFLHLGLLLFFLFIIKKWLFNMQLEKKEFSEIDFGKTHYPVYVGPKITNINDFFACVSPNLILLPLLTWTFFFSPISWLFWDWIDEVAQKTKKDGTDWFFLSTEIPTNRKQVFYRKVLFLVIALLSLYFITFALPLALLLTKKNFFSNFTSLQTFLFLGWNFLITPLFFFLPFVIFLFSLASLNSVWYVILKCFGRLSLLIAFLVVLFAFLGLRENRFGERVLEYWTNLTGWLSRHYFLVTLVIIGTIFCLSFFTLSLAYKKYQREDLK